MVLDRIFAILDRLDWPNAVAGATLGALLGLIVWLATRAYKSRFAGKDLPYRISGTWYSAEFDAKAQVPRKLKNTLTEVKIRRLLGGRVSLEVTRQLDKHPHKPPTAWKVISSLVKGDTLVGTWTSKIEHTKRYGTAILKFIEYGRAVGYWTGPAGKDYPVYGYWIMARNEGDLRRLAADVLKNTNFEFTDVAKHILSSQPPRRGGQDANSAVSRQD